jgi:putative membrane protein
MPCGRRGQARATDSDECRTPAATRSVLSDEIQVKATDTLANERTYLAYVRTALAFIAFGFVIARFSLFTREFAVLVHSATSEQGVSTEFGTAMAAFGIAIALLGAWRYAVTDRGLREGQVVRLSTVTGYIISLAVVIIGAIVAFELLSYR